MLAYSLRKRAWQERFPLFRSTMMTWLWAHVAFGFMALVIASFHGGYGLFSFNMSTGKVAFALFSCSALTGIVWRMVYEWSRRAPHRASATTPRKGALKRAEEQLTEIEKLAAGDHPRCAI